MKKKKIGIREYYRLNPTCICGKLINKGQPFGGHPEHKVEQEPTCNCCGWDDEGYSHEPSCATMSPKQDTWEEELRRMWGHDDHTLLINTNVLIDFIRSELQSQRQEIVEKIRKHKKCIDEECWLIDELELDK